MDLNNMQYDKLKLFITKLKNDSESIEKNKMNTEDICLICKKKYNFVIDNTTNEKICNNCGSVIELNNFDTIASYDESYTTSTTIIDTSSINITIKGITNWKIKKFYDWHFVMSYKERSINETFKYIYINCKKLNLINSVIDDAKILYKIIKNNYTDIDLNKNNYIKMSQQRMMRDKNLPHKIVTRGNNKIGIIGACIYYACKKSGYYHTIREISQILSVKSSFINNGCKIFSKCIKQANIDIDVNLSYPKQYLKNLSIILKLEQSDIDKILKILLKIELNNLISIHTPYSITVAVIIMYLEHNKIEISKKELSHKLSISLVTINKTIKTLLTFKDYLLNDLDNVLILKVTNRLTSADLEKIKNIKQKVLDIDISEYENLQIDLNTLFNKY